MASETEDNSKGPFLRAVGRGARRKCPSCGEGKLFDSYLKPTTACKICGVRYDHIRTDDFAPWLTIIVLGHILVPLVYHFDVAFKPPYWALMTGALTLVVVAILGLLPMATGVSIDFRKLAWNIGGESSQWWGPMAVAVIFGLGVATLLTLVVTPVLVSLTHSFQTRFKGRA